MKKLSCKPVKGNTSASKSQELILVRISFSSYRKSGVIVVIGPTVYTGIRPFAILPK